jgi:hypothetical protein
MYDLQNHVNEIAARLSNGFDGELNADNEPMSAYDYLTDALDIEWLCGRDKTYLGARVLVAFGGPNIWINTRTNTVEGHWWGESATASYTDELDLDGALADLFAC